MVWHGHFHRGGESYCQSHALPSAYQFYTDHYFKEDVQSHMWCLKLVNQNENQDTLFLFEICF